MGIVRLLSCFSGKMVVSSASSFDSCLCNKMLMWLSTAVHSHSNAHPDSCSVGDQGKDSANWEQGNVQIERDEMQSTTPAFCEWRSLGRSFRRGCLERQCPKGYLSARDLPYAMNTLAMGEPSDGQNLCLIDKAHSTASSRQVPWALGLNREAYAMELVAGALPSFSAQCVFPSEGCSGFITCTIRLMTRLI